MLWISLPYATFGLVLERGKVVQAPPIARWTIGKTMSTVVNYYRKKGATIRPIGF